MKNIKVKVCGMKESDNIKQLSALDIDFIGFNFYEKSKRYINDLKASDIDSIPASISRVGVFVNDDIVNLLDKFKAYKLNYVQLHGDESVDYCNALFEMNIPLIKVFRLENKADMDEIVKFKPYCKYFLFDSKTPLYGGSGAKFKWEILNDYSLDIPYFLSGGIDINDVDEIKLLKQKSVNFFGIDINSKFETEPGIKDIDKISVFINKLT